MCYEQHVKNRCCAFVTDLNSAYHKKHCTFCNTRNFPTGIMQLHHSAFVLLVTILGSLSFQLVLSHLSIYCRHYQIISVIIYNLGVVKGLNYSVDITRQVGACISRSGSLTNLRLKIGKFRRIVLFVTENCIVCYKDK